MRKFFLSLVVMLVASVFTGKVYAQSSTLATLNHEGTIRTFYGTTALKQAHDAAVNGDVITLSSGNFLAVDITKAITVRGTGMGIDTTAGIEPTIITGDFKFNIADAGSYRLTLEGIYSNHTITYLNAVNPLFLKCRLNKITYGYTSYGGNTGVLKDASFIHCRIVDRLSLSKNCSASCVNSVIQNPCSDQSSSNFEFTNCVLFSDVTSYYEICSVNSSLFRNCIIGTNSSSDCMNDNCTAYGCIGLGNTGIFKNATNATNTIVSDYTTLFKSYTGASLGNLDSETFELTDEAKAKYLGTDGTEVGIYGGNLPFDPTPSNPQITKCNVASKSTADGKLSVDIEVRAAE